MIDPSFAGRGSPLKPRVRSGLAGSVERVWSVDVDPLSSTERVTPREREGVHVEQRGDDLDELERCHLGQRSTTANTTAKKTARAGHIHSPASSSS